MGLADAMAPRGAVPAKRSLHTLVWYRKTISFVRLGIVYRTSHERSGEEARAVEPALWVDDVRCCGGSSVELVREGVLHVGGALDP